MLNGEVRAPSTLSEELGTPCPLVVAGSPRSGNTWLSEVLTALPGSGWLNEPLHLTWYPEAQDAGFSWRTYVRPDADWPSGQQFLSSLFQGQVTREKRPPRGLPTPSPASKFLIVKFIRANRMLSWLCRNLPILPPVLLIRHPCAVVASRLRSNTLNKTFELKEPEFLADYPAFRPLLERLSTLEEYLAATWAIDYYLPLVNAHPWPWQLLSYEQLVLDFDNQIQKMLTNWGLEVPPDIFSRAEVPSLSVGRDGISGIAGWKERLEPDQIRRILDVVHAFGLDFYDENPESDYARLHHPDLPGRLQQAGLK